MQPPIDDVTHADVAVVGAGPAGLMLAHRLGRNGIDCVNVEVRERREIETTHRAGILEAGNAADLVDLGVSDRILRDGVQHDGVELRFGGRGHRIDFRRLVGAGVWLYPQTDVVTDLANARERDGGTVHYGIRDVEVSGVETRSPTVRFTAPDGGRTEIRTRIVVGADGSRSHCRTLVPERHRTQWATEYPYAWFGILCDAPPSAPELVYAHSASGFALISQRSDTVQRMYFQCQPDEQVSDWPAECIWQTLQQRVAGDGFALREGPIRDPAVLRFRGFVQQPMRWGSLVLVGDAAHTVPPTGARGLNLALHDVKVCAEHITEALGSAGLTALDGYQPRALRRVWRAQSFATWMTRMLHTDPAGGAFDLARQAGELDNVTSTEAGQRYLAEQYTGWPGLSD